MQRKPALQHALQEAQAHHRAGRLTQTVRCYRRILSLLPLHPEANAQLGALLLQQGQAEQAVALLIRARQAQPQVVQHWVRLLSALQLSGDVHQARDLMAEATPCNIAASELERLSQSLSEPPKSRQQGLVTLYQQGKHLNTEIAAWMFRDDYPDHPLGLQILGAVLHDSGKLAEALDIKQQTVTQFPNDANAHNNLAHTLLALQRYEEALASARAALKLNPTLIQARTHEQQALAGLEEKTTCAK